MFQKSTTHPSKSKNLETVESFSEIAEGTKDKERTRHENKNISKTEKVKDNMIKSEKEKKETSEASKETKSKPSKHKALD